MSARPDLWEDERLLFSSSIAGGSFGLEIPVGRLTVSSELKHNEPLFLPHSHLPFLKMKKREGG